MANRRMFAKTIIDSDAFLDMPSTTQNLYFHLSMRADDDGFVNNPKSIMRVVGSKDDDFRVLEAKRFIIPFDSGVVVIKHWKIHNYIQNDRYTPTKYQEEKKQLYVNEKDGYSLKEIRLFDEEEANVSTMYPQVRLELELGKDKLGESKKEISKEKKTTKSTRFVKPSVDELVKHLQDWYVPKSKREGIAEDFIRFYESKGWLVGKSPMKNWKMAMSGWVKRAGYIEKDNDVKEMEKEAGCELWKSD
ncbi:MAG: hypothetical protein RBR97_07225 [Bacteroidales bacterium]|nr:hypothetical protein [Bacteroidales bacterium]